MASHLGSHLSCVACLKPTQEMENLVSLLPQRHVEGFVVRARGTPGAFFFRVICSSGFSRGLFQERLEKSHGEIGASVSCD